MGGADFPRYAVTTDVVIFAVRQHRLQLLLIQRANEPDRGKWALPGGFVEPDEDLEASARRELQEETGVQDLYLEQLSAFGAPGRDPRGRTITIAYYALVPPDELRAQAADDAAAVDWFPVDDLPELAFDHSEIIRVALDRLRDRVSHAGAALRLLPDTFTLPQLLDVQQLVLGDKVDADTLRERAAGSGELEWTGQTRDGERLYRRRAVTR